MKRRGLAATGTENHMMPVSNAPDLPDLPDMKPMSDTPSIPGPADDSDAPLSPDAIADRLALALARAADDVTEPLGIPIEGNPLFEAILEEIEGLDDALDIELNAFFERGT